MIEGKFGIIRHGYKTSKSEEGLQIEQVLTPKQQVKWNEAVKALGIEDNPELKFENVPLLEQRAKDMVYGSEKMEALPEKALLIMVSTKVPRNQLTADLLSMSVLEEAREAGKDIRVGYIWEPEEELEKKDNPSEIAKGVPNFRVMMRKVAEEEYSGDRTLARYLSGAKWGNFAHPLEDEVILKAINNDLAKDDSVVRKRAELLKEQVKNFAQKFEDIADRPVYLLSVSHHSGVAAFEVAFHGRERFENVDQIYQPLDLFEVPFDEIK